MKDQAINKLISIQENIKNLNTQNDIPAQIVCVSKTFPLSKLLPLVNFGHYHFGENKVQEAEEKWSELKKSNENLKLHMVGRLQTNKVKKAVQIFDFIHSVDSQKLADNLKKREEEINRKLSYFIQINLGNESQKGGVKREEAESFVITAKIT
jgi:Predicted enzyme with a TIM-barrel fold